MTRHYGAEATNAHVLFLLTLQNNTLFYFYTDRNEKCVFLTEGERKRDTS